MLLRISAPLVVCAGLLVASMTHAAPSSTKGCIESASNAYSVDLTLLEAIAEVESGMRPEAMNLGHIDRTGSYDIGWFQINSGWLPKLKKFGIDEATLKAPCVNANVGAWILRNLIEQHGKTWKAVGAYNASCSTLKGNACDAARLTYVNKVFRAYQRRSGHEVPKPSGATARGTKSSRAPVVSSLISNRPSIRAVAMLPTDEEADAIVSWAENAMPR